MFALLLFYSRCAFFLSRTATTIHERSTKGNTVGLIRGYDVFTLHRKEWSSCEKIAAVTKTPLARKSAVHHCCRSQRWWRSALERHLQSHSVGKAYLGGKRRGQTLSRIILNFKYVFLIDTSKTKESEGFYILCSGRDQTWKITCRILFWKATTMMEYGNNNIINNSPELSNYIHFMTPLKIHISVALRKLFLWL